ncbi:MAG: diaminopimelate epimerase [Bacteroidota bacterium]|nr:diaminopimelate epimerase [Bacteroidota bacterium]
MTIEFYKYQGTGNDFILIDNRKSKLQLSYARIKFLCNRHFGIGADGLMLLEDEISYDFKMVYYNSDGHESSMCGNGGRCIMAFAKQLGIVKEKARFLAIDGPHDALILPDDVVSLKMNDVKNIEMDNDHFFINTGSPHYIKQAEKVSAMNVVEEGRKIRNSERFKEEGTNVNFMEKFDDHIYIRTYERGVEDETLSCGTGVTAVALAAACIGMSTSKNNCAVRTQGGMLNVKFDKVLANTFYNIWLEGPAHFVFKGAIDIE